MKRFLRGFLHAGRGIAAAWQGELNIKVMLVLSVIAVALGFYQDISSLEWALIILCIGMVLALEIMNTALEKFIDLQCPDHDPRYGRIKDMAAGAVLTLSVAAGIIGFLILLL
jgi:diacylglycerol kinase (ATP)